MWPTFCAFLLVSGPFALVMGLNRGLGLQRANALCVLCVVWPVGAPLVTLWAQTPSSIWLALMMTFALLTGCMATCAVCSSWAALAEKAHAASGGDKEGSSTGNELSEASGGAGLAAADAAKERL